MHLMLGILGGTVHAAATTALLTPKSAYMVFNKSLQNACTSAS